MQSPSPTRLSRSGSQSGRRPIITSYKLTEHLPGYTGFVPKLQNVIATTYATSSRVALMCPPTPDLETVDYDFLAGSRRLRTASPLAGTGFHGFIDEMSALPFEGEETQQREYRQGGRVNLGSYYSDQHRKMETMKRINPRAVTQKRNPVRNMSQVPFGDDYYYSGKHMFETTTKEAQAQANPPPKHDLMMTSMAIRGDARELGYEYKIAHAMIGATRLDLLHKEVAERVQAKVVTGNKDMIRMFNFFAKKRSGSGHVSIGHKEFLGIVQKLEVYMTEREACALFGRYDKECSGAKSYFEFIDLFFDEGERIRTDQ
mmetsp:Transcript_3480/g.6933  ORF Transcript_3480/g.6933 Transcript_3480/m.6933 type:complete len:316 (-) Transcript_3480:79-1026(-)|eukprot:CAMPEP_0173379924 /NCGR_PEP_ID=MMETSP1356-20130122/2717_1 /TAXON_ID=77927 ORGANISM="Hemiselmis virescens, Strain PCC157" /NCGR_SAMPLE_ID=MMETSP1356 /ASSEMBLY_ACC=CAM_ASM_000847 /LENGTH=315 /DNA_ID=CAMNT_0014333365 /DNA_START=239 /DNA_END=1186 /DNA_ORIENTATION=-